jgi:anaerobic selenocysteine-containing dehydrogenase
MHTFDTPWIKSTCAYCGVGCGIEAKALANGRIEVRGDNSHPANLGIGRYSHQRRAIANTESQWRGLQLG